MLTPDFSRRRVRSEPKLNQSVEQQTPPGTPESKRYDRPKHKGHILIQKRDNERHPHGGKAEKSPHARRQEIHKNLQGQSQPSSSARKQHLEMLKELQNVSEKIGLCYEQLKSDYMREMARDLDLNAADSGHVLALKDLFQQLMNEMVHLKGILSQYKITNGGEVNSFEKPANTQVSDTTGPNDLVYLKGPITEDTVITILQARFDANCYHTKVGPVHLIINPFNSSESKYHSNPPHLRSIVTPALEKLFETQTPQMLILSGECGSGKSHTAQMLIGELMHLSCGTSETNLKRHLNAAVTALNSLGNARTMNNQESSKLAFLYEFYFNNQVIHKTKIKCIPLVMSRIVQPRKDESNFRIFYQLFAGLNPQERAKLQLHTHSADELQYLYNYPSDNESEIELLRKEFQSWKSALQFLGIPFTDVTKVLAAILLLGNVQFTEKSPRVLEVHGGVFELKAVSILLGIPYTSLFCGLTKKLKVTKSDATIQSCSATQANHNRDALAKSLYLRMLSAIVRRSNCSRKSAVSTEHNSSNNRDASESVLSPNVGDHVLGIADLFGFDKTNCNRMEQICANLCSETIQHFYTTHVFKSAEEYCREEGIQNELDVGYHDNSECIELLTCQETGILTYLDRETLGNGSTENLVEKLRTKHANHKKFFTTNCKWNEFGIAHHTEKVIYDADALLRANDDSIADDIIQMFSSEQCSFGFAVHLFASDLNLLPQKDNFDIPGMVDRFDSSISSSAQTFSQKYQERLDELLKTLINSDPWFILCLKSNSNGVPTQFDPETVSRQIESLQVFETVHLLRSGYTHRMRLIPFAQRYFVHDEQLSQTDALEIAQSYQKLLNESKKENPHKILYIGRKHVFLSEILWQELENRRLKRHPSEDLRSSFDTSDASSIPTDRYRKDISPATRDERADTSHSRAESGVSTPPAIPKRRGYTVIDNKKIAFPQVRVMTDDYRDRTNGQDVVFTSGENVKVIGASPKAGYLAVESRHKTGWVPYTFTRLMTDDVM